MYGKKVYARGGSRGENTTFGKVMAALREKGPEDWDLIMTEMDAWGNAQVIKALKGMKEVLTEEGQTKMRRKRKADLMPMRPWQASLIEYILNVKFDREFIWLWESEGNIGKSWLVDLLITKHNFILCKKGSNADMVENICSQYNGVTGANGGFVFDLTRACDPTDAATFGMVPDLVEDLKNGRIIRKKYQAGMYEFQKPTTVVIFANCEPPAGAWSKDRYGQVWNMRSVEFTNRFGLASMPRDVEMRGGKLFRK